VLWSEQGEDRLTSGEQDFVTTGSVTISTKGVGAAQEQGEGFTISFFTTLHYFWMLALCSLGDYLA